MSEPLYAPGNVVYIRESAGQGFFEAVKIAAVRSITDGEWYYTIAFDGKLPGVVTFGDRINHHQPNEIELSESELVSFCDAADLIEDFHSAELLRVRAKISDRCD